MAKKILLVGNNDFTPCWQRELSSEGFESYIVHTVKAAIDFLEAQKGEAYMLLVQENLPVCTPDDVREDPESKIIEHFGPMANRDRGQCLIQYLKARRIIPQGAEAYLACVQSAIKEQPDGITRIIGLDSDEKLVNLLTPRSYRVEGNVRLPDVPVKDGNVRSQ